MTYDERRTTIVRDPLDPAPPVVRSRDVPVSPDGQVVEERRQVASRPTGATFASRIVVAVFGIVQRLIGLRILLLASDAREGNALVAAILDLSQPLVAPFEGILRTNALESGGAVLDLAAVAALIGWTVLELVILGVLRIGRSGDQV